MPETTKSNDTTVAKAGHGKGFAVASMVCGIVALVCCWNIWLSLILAVIALVFGIIALVKKYPAKGMAIAGVVTGGIGLLISVALYALVFSVASSVVNSVNDYDWDNIDWSDVDWDDIDWEEY